MTQSAIGVNAVPGKEDDARKIMAALGYTADSDRTTWQVPFTVGYVDARNAMIRALDEQEPRWQDALIVSNIPAHPDYDR